MSETPPLPSAALPAGGERDRTPELTSKREKRSRPDDEDDHDRSEMERDRDREHRRHRDRDANEEDDRERDRRHRHRHRERDEEEDEERRERHRRRHENETEEDREEREERRRRRREREYDERERPRDTDRDRDRDREREDGRRGVRGDERDGDRYRDRDRDRYDDRDRERERRHRRDRDRSRESHRSHRSSHRGQELLPEESSGGLPTSSREQDHRRSASHGLPPPPPDLPPNPIREMTREEKEMERERRDREMQDERRERARMRGDDDRFGRDGRDSRYSEDRGPPPPRRGPPGSPGRYPYSPQRRDSPNYDARPPPPREDLPPPPPPREKTPPIEKDPINAFLDEVDSENRSIFVTQLASRLTSQDLGLFFEDMLGRGAVRDARVVTDKVSRRSKGIAYVELDAVELVNKALSLSGTLVMGIPIQITVSEAEKNRAAQMEAISNGTFVLPTPKADRERERGPGRREDRGKGRDEPRFPPLSTDLKVPPGVEPNAHAEASIPHHRLFISGLSYSLSADDLKQVFQPFGEVDFVDLHKDQHGTSKGTAYVQYRYLRGAQIAMDSMNGFELAGRPLRVQATVERSFANDQIEDPNGAGPHMDNNTRQSLMAKLARKESGASTPHGASSNGRGYSSSQVTPTTYIVVGNMFNPEEETERNWDLDLAEDVKGEVEGKYGPLRRIKVDKMSAGEVYMEFSQQVDAEKALRGLGGRFFGGRQLSATFVSETIFRAHM